MKPLDPDLAGILACPETGEKLAWQGEALVGPSGQRFPVLDRKSTRLNSSH